MNPEITKPETDMLKIRAVLVTLLLAVLSFPGNAAPPTTMQYEGYLTSVTGVPETDTLDITFSLYTTLVGGETSWTETHTAVQVTNGVFTVSLGSKAAFTNDLFTKPLFLGVSVDQDCNGIADDCGVLSPRLVLSSVPYVVTSAQTVACAEDLNACDGTCRNLQTDLENCGVCNTVCGINAIGCDEGRCICNASASGSLCNECFDGFTKDGSTGNCLAVNQPPTAVAFVNGVTTLPENTSVTSRVKLADILVTDDALGDEALSVSNSNQFEIADNILYLKQGTDLNFESSPTNYSTTVAVDDTTVGATPDLTSATFTVTITDVNEAPTAVSFSNSVTTLPENTSVTSRVKLADILVTDDALGDEALSVSNFSRFEIADNILYLKQGTDLDFESDPTNYSTTVTVDDTTVGATPDLTSANFSITMENVNEAPSGTDKTTSVLNNTTLSFTAADFGFSDPNDFPANELSAVIIASLNLAPGAGLKLNGADLSAEQTISAGNLTSLVFTPQSSGDLTSSRLTFQVQDNGGALDGGIDVDQTANNFTINVLGANEAPTISNIADQVTNEATTIIVAFTVDEGVATGEDGQTLTVTATSSVQPLVPDSAIAVNYSDNGAASASDLSPTLTITPAPINGVTTITVTVTDNGNPAKSASDTFVLTVNGIPAATNTSASTAQNTATTITLVGSDAEGSALTYTVVTNPTQGNLAGSGNTRTYTPNTGVTGSDSFTYKVNDGVADSPVATVNITISGADGDGDGFTSAGGDCDDTQASVNPGATEICGDGVDQDCNGTADDGACSGGGGGDVCAPLTTCGGSCSDTLTDPNNCGGCGTVCSGLTPVCSGGGCVPAGAGI